MYQIECYIFPLNQAKTYKMYVGWVILFKNSQHLSLKNISPSTISSTIKNTISGYDVKLHFTTLVTHSLIGLYFGNTWRWIFNFWLENNLFHCDFQYLIHEFNLPR